MFSFSVGFPFLCFLKLKNHKNIKSMKNPKICLSLPFLKYIKPTNICIIKNPTLDKQAAPRGCQVLTISGRTHLNSAISCMWLQSETKSRTEHLTERRTSKARSTISREFTRHREDQSRAEHSQRL